MHIKYHTIIRKDTLYYIIIILHKQEMSVGEDMKAYTDIACCMFAERIIYHFRNYIYDGIAI